MKVCLITATKNRHKQLERLVRFFLDQTYEDSIHLIFNNSSKPLRLNKNLPEDRFILVNNHLSLKTGKPYETLGEIYNDAIKFVPGDIDIVSFFDDDDIFLPDHIEEGVKGMKKGGLLAYKPKKSFYKYLKSPTQLVENTMEPSIFVDYNHLKVKGFSLETTAQHHQWLVPLVESKQIFVDPEGKPTYICDWSQQIGTFKTSGDPHNPNNFKNYEVWSQDTGDGIITPCSKSWANHYYKMATEK